MSRIEQLKEKISVIYQARNPDRADWADWLFENHIFVVAGYAEKLAERFGANKELAMAAGMLHDIADAIMSRENPEHELKSEEIARSLLQQTGFWEQEIKIIVDDAIRFHGCHGTNLPQTLEGKVMATADALAHLATKFYDFALERLREKESLAEIRTWASSKIERDYLKKIFFAEVRTEIFQDYKRVKRLFTL